MVKGRTDDVGARPRDVAAEATTGQGTAGEEDEGSRDPDDVEVYGGRYEIEGLIARGGMAEVYRGRDRQLDRPVAVKVLSAELSRDASFVERFRREARQVANLSHPNIVEVYDWGEREGTYYIVMAYVEGRTLGDVLRREGPLHPDRAAEVAIEITAALGFAHRNGVIHRDIKPGNVLLTPTGGVQVADFGIARDATDRGGDLTQAGSVIGTAAYLSPEQAQALPIDPRSDLYSLGCVLYEALTGQPPFTGPTPVSVAYRHVQEQASPPSALAEKVPPGLDAICLKLLAKDPADRYSSAEDARADLRRFREGKPVLAGPVPAVGGDGGDEELEDGIEVDEPPRRVGVLVFSLVLLLLVLAGLLALLVDSLTSDEVAAGSAVVPDVVELEVGEARDLLSEAGFIPLTAFEENDDYPEDVVFGQEPPSGTKLELGSEVVLKVSSGGSTVPVPEVVGLQSTAARAHLESTGFVVEEVKEFHEVAAIGEVIRQDPAARQDVPVGSLVTLTVSKGPKPIEIPDLKNKSELEAANALGNLGFEVVFFEEESEEVEEGKVVRTDPPAGEKLPPGSTVTVILSTGKFILMPDVVGLPSEQAITVIRTEGLQPSLETQLLPTGHPDDGKVVAQLPVPNEKVLKGAVVILRVGFAPPESSTTSRPPTIDVFKLTPGEIDTGGDRIPVLSWATSGGDSVRIEGPSGEVISQSRSDALEVCPGAQSGGSCNVPFANQYTYTLKIFVNGQVVAQRAITLRVS